MAGVPLKERVIGPAFREIEGFRVEKVDYRQWGVYVSPNTEPVFVGTLKWCRQAIRDGIPHDALMAYRRVHPLRPSRSEPIRLEDDE